MTFAWVTGNRDKVTVLQRQINEANLGLPDIIQVDINLREVLANPKTIAVYKANMAYEAMQNPDMGALVEDTTLHIFDKNGLQISGWEPELVKYNITRLSEFVGLKATWVSHMAIADGKEVLWTCSSVEGVIVPYENMGKGFDGYIKPNGSDKVYAYRQEGIYSPRFANYLKLMTAPNTCFREIFTPNASASWQGEWQNG